MGAAGLSAGVVGSCVSASVVTVESFGATSGLGPVPHVGGRSGIVCVGDWMVASAALIPSGTSSMRSVVSVIGLTMGISLNGVGVP